MFPSGSAVKSVWGSTGLDVIAGGAAVVGASMCAGRLSRDIRLLIAGGFSDERSFAYTSRSSSVKISPSSVIVLRV